MKKNLILFGVLVLLIIITYFFQEKRVEQEFKNAITEGRLLEAEITRIKLPSVDAEKRDGQWWSGKQLLSSNAFKKIELKLGEIKTFKEIEGDPKDFFKDALEFEVNGEPWKIGEMSLDNQSFYVSKGNKISLAIIDAASTTITSEEAEIEEGKVNELKTALTKSLKQLKENQLFRYYPKLPLERVQFQAEGNVPYELLLHEDATIPPPIQGVLVHEKLKDKLFSILTQIKLKDEVDYSPKLKFKKLAQIYFSKKGEPSVTWQLWLRARDSADAVLIDDDRKVAYHMIGGTLTPFFLGVQEYWDRKVIPPTSFKTFSRLPVTFRQGKKEALVTLLNKQPLDFEIRGFKVKPGNMQDLFQLLFNLGPLDQASRVSQLSPSEKQQFLSADHLRVSLLDEELLCVRKKDEIIVVNLTRGFKAHFINAFENLHCSFEDVLE